MRLPDPIADPPAEVEDAAAPAIGARAVAAREALLRPLLTLAIPVLAENALNIAVGLNDAYLGNHLDAAVRVNAAAAIGTVAYLVWFVGLFSGALGTGATAIISRAIGARHRARAHAATGQAMLLAGMLGATLGLGMFLFAPLVAHVSGLSSGADAMAIHYIRILSPGLPCVVLLFVANSCLRGAGDTRTPMIAMCIVNTINVALTWSLTFGHLGFAPMGISGIAVGTAAAYTFGAVMQVAVLLKGVGKLRLRMHRLRLHPVEMKRLLKIGLPSAAESAMMWSVNFYMVHVVNRLGPASSAAHLNSVRIESLAFMTGFAIAAAVSTMVGQSLGMRQPERARRVANLGYGLAGGAMAVLGLIFIFAGGLLARIMSEDPVVRTLSTKCLFITGFAEWAFAAYIIYSAALRGAGKTRAVMFLNAGSVVGARLGGVFIVGVLFHGSLPAIWVVLAGELLLRGTLAYTGFRTAVLD